MPDAPKEILCFTNCDQYEGPAFLTFTPVGQNKSNILSAEFEEHRKGIYSNIGKLLNLM